MTDNAHGLNHGAQQDWVEGLLIGLADHKVFIRSSEIKEVLRPVAFTVVPMVPEHVIGLANIHGQVVCIIDAGGVSALPLCNREVTERTRFLVLHHPVMHIALWVDDIHKTQRSNATELANSEKNNDSVCRIELDGIACDYLQCMKLLDCDSSTDAIDIGRYKA
ncbi:MAG: chemotaxis protein CheW [Mariprofundaceae bacterium]|nr:chemotaxis protein CheW [Mariprofundaceae bacterium]